MTELNYQDLVKDYYDNLNNNLRNFKGGPGFLETWVHDEDHNRSILEILDLAHSSGIAELSIRLPADVSGGLDLTWLRLQAAAYGSVKLDGTQLKFVAGKSAGSGLEMGAVGELYRDNVQRHKVTSEGALEAKGGKVFKAQDGGVLAVLVDDAGLVKEARHTGFAGPVKSVVDAFCTILKGRPLQEGAEHGTIRLETSLRAGDRPVRAKGLFTPELGDPIFATPNRLARKLFNEYLKSMGKGLERNYWRDPIPASWMGLTPEAKVAAAQEILLKGCDKLGLQKTVQVTQIKHDTRFVLTFTQDPTKPNFGHSMIKLERWLRGELKFEVELQLESIEDRNKRVQRSGRTEPTTDKTISAKT